MKQLLVMFLLVVTGAGHAQTSIGSITEQQGLVTLVRGQQRIVAAPGTQVNMKDRVETKNGRAKITFQDSTVVTVAESSALDIDEFVYDPASSKNSKLGLRAAQGTVRYVSGNIAAKNPNAVNIRTPTAAIAVRGTDFVMSVNEVGSSMVILMPSCEGGPIVSCSSGKIDVSTQTGTVSMNRPYQATLVETSSSQPPAPIVVNLAGAAINNNLQIAPPRTATGMSIVVAARAAVDRTQERKRDSGSEVATEEQTAATNEQDKSEKQHDKTEIVVNTERTASQVAAVTATSNPYLFKLWRDRSETQQIGWLYESLSESKFNYANIILPLGTQVQVTVTQDMLTHGYNFGNGKTQGSITITQTYK